VNGPLSLNDEFAQVYHAQFIVGGTGRDGAGTMEAEEGSDEQESD
jgi:hypothetical protein